MTSDLEPRLSEWLSGRVPSDVPSDLMASVRAIPHVSRGQASSPAVPSPGAAHSALALRPRVAWLGIMLTVLLAATVAVIAFVGARPTPVVQGVFDPGPALDRPRQNHSATLLDDGRVLLAGGDDGDGALASTTIYDPATGRFDPGPPMTTARTHPSAVLLDDGRVLVVGGADRPSAEIFDPATGTFSPTGAPSGAWDDARAIRLPDGQVLIVGTGGPAAAIYDPASASFSTIPIPDLGYGPTAALLADGRHVLLIAGEMPEPAGDVTTHPPRFDSSAWLLDVAAQTVTPTGSLRSARVHPLPLRVPDRRVRRDMAAVPLDDGRVLVVGGYAKEGGGPYPIDVADIYDPDTGVFSPAGSLKVARVAPTVTRLPDGRVLVAGGSTWDGAAHEGKLPIEPSTGSAEIFDPATGRFELTDPMTGPRDSHSATLLHDDRVLVAGGEATGGITQGASLINATEFFE
jgi:hypothetical protein